MLKAVILDWAGTVLDHGSRAPMGAFVKAFAAFGVTNPYHDSNLFHVTSNAPDTTWSTLQVAVRKAF